ncbi:MAG: carboxylating nicotinate-nucleotide diphosphorylase, partial [Planctomycetales bacterium]
MAGSNTDGIAIGMGLIAVRAIIRYYGCSMADFRQIEWDELLEDDCRQIIRLAVREDLDRGLDWTTVALVPADARASAAVVARKAGVIAGLKAAQIALDEMNASISWTATADEGQRVVAGDSIAVVEGSARDILTSERIVLNLLGHLSGIATVTRQYVDAITGSTARIYDTRKTTPGWRRLEKYAVQCGGGRNHRTGLYDAILIKDNHLAHFEGSDNSRASDHRSLAGIVGIARKFAAEKTTGARLLVEIEVDSIEQFAEVLTTAADIILLDNMSLDELREAVGLRDRAGSDIELEASGGINLMNVSEIAATGI